MNYFSDLTFVGFGKIRKSTNVIRNRLFDGYYGVQFIRDGDFYVECEGEEPWKSEGPLIFITAPGKRFTYYSVNGAYHAFACFKGERAKRYLEGGLLPAPGKKIAITEADEFNTVMENLLRCLRRNTPTAHAEAVLHLEHILLLAGSQPASRMQGNRIRESVDHIAEHPEKNWNFKKLSSELNISEIHFRRIFIRETGMPPRQFVIHHRIRYAAQLLQDTSMRIKEIAFQCGFSGEFYFSRQFCKIMKYSPSEYRKKFINFQERF